MPREVPAQLAKVYLINVDAARADITADNLIKVLGGETSEQSVAVQQIGEVLVMSQRYKSSSRVRASQSLNK